MRIAYVLATALAFLAAPELQAQPGPGAQTIQETPGLGLPAGIPAVCSIEMKATTKVIHGSVCKQYCQPHILPHCIRERLGLACDCGTLRTFNVLTKKVVPGTPMPVCRAKPLSAESVPPLATPKSP